jgi:hypothetical protein
VRETHLCADGPAAHVQRRDPPVALAKLIDGHVADTCNHQSALHCATRGGAVLSASVRDLASSEEQSAAQRVAKHTQGFPKRRQTHAGR